MSGARAALDYFHVPDADKRVTEYAQLKQEMVVRLIEAGDFTAYPDALSFVIAAKDAGMRIADASSSKNAGLFLRQIRLDTFAAEHGISSPTLRPGQTPRSGAIACWPCFCQHENQLVPSPSHADGCPIT